MRALLIPPSQEEHCSVVDVSEDSTLEDLQKLVGGMVETIGFNPPTITPYFNEEGKLLELPANPRATAVLSGSLWPNDLVAGPLVLIGFDGEAGEERDLPEWFIEGLPEGWLA